MRKKLTITIDERVYSGLHEVVGRRKISQFIEDLARPHVVHTGLEAAYKAMAQDSRRELDADLWSEGVLGEMADEDATR